MSNQALPRGWGQQDLAQALLLADPTIDDAVDLLDGPLVHKHGVLRVAGLQHVLLPVLVGCGETGAMGESASANWKGLQSCLEGSQLQPLQALVRLQVAPLSESSQGGRKGEGKGTE